MRVISVPKRLLLALTLLLLTIPLAALETVISARAPWWRLPYKNMAFWATVAAVVFVPLLVSISRGKNGSVVVLGVMASLWSVLSGWVAFRFDNTSLGFFTVFLMFYWLVSWLWVRHELARSYFDPHLHWYEGLPQGIPGLDGRLAQGEGRVLVCKVCRLDRDGAFIYSETESLGKLQSQQLRELTFSYREKQVRCLGRPVRELKGGLGAGFLFTGMSPDLRKELGDFVERLGGEGHV